MTEPFGILQGDIAFSYSEPYAFCHMDIRQLLPDVPYLQTCLEHTVQYQRLTSVTFKTSLYTTIQYTETVH